MYIQALTQMPLNKQKGPDFPFSHFSRNIIFDQEKENGLQGPFYAFRKILYKDMLTKVGVLFRSSFVGLDHWIELQFSPLWLVLITIHILTNLFR
jgi:hypothetical protein